MRFQRSASVALFLMNTEYCFRKAETNCVKLSIGFSSKPANQSRAEPVRFSSNKRQYPASFSSLLRCAIDTASLKARIWAFTSVIPEFTVGKRSSPGFFDSEIDVRGRTCRQVHDAV